jgi:hypothetical protein
MLEFKYLPTRFGKNFEKLAAEGTHLLTVFYQMVNGAFLSTFFGFF